MTEDLFERLDQFRSDAPGVPMKPAAAVRRRGDQIRRRTRILAGAGAAVVAAAVVVPVLALTGGTGSRDIDPAPQPASTSSHTDGPLTAANLLTAEDVGEGPVANTYAREGANPWHPCASHRLTDLGAIAVFRLSLPTRYDGSAGLVEQIADFGTPAQAEDAYRKTAEMWRACGQHIAGNEPGATVVVGPLAHPSRDLGVPGAAFERVFKISGDEGGRAQPSTVRWLDSGVVRSGSRIAVLEHTTYHKSHVDDSISRLIPRAADRLVNGGGTATGRGNAPSGLPAAASSGPATPATSGPAAPATSAARSPDRLDATDLPLASELPELDRFESTLGWNRYTPTPEVPTLACQKEWLSALSPADKVTVDFRWDSDSAMVGQVHVAVLEFGDVNAAGAAYNEVMEWQEVCPADELGVTPTVTEKPIDISRDLGNGIDRAARSHDTYAAKDVAGGDSSWFDTELVAQKDTRLVLVGYGELAGPCPPSTGDKNDPCYEPDQPDSWPARVLAIEKAAVEAGFKD